MSAFPRQQIDVNSPGGSSSLGPTTPTTFTQGSVLFAGSGGVLSQDNTNFFWDNTAKTLKVPKLVGLNNGYGTANAGITFANGTQLSANADGRLWIGSSGTDAAFGLLVPDGAIQLGNGYQVAWTSTGSAAAATDIGLARSAAGVLRVSDGTSGLGKLIIGGATPASASATGTTGQILWDSSYIYIATGTNTWKRVAIATW